MTEKIPDILHGFKGQLFFQGKFFDESQKKEFWEFVKEWPIQKLDQETAERLFKTFSKDCVMNLFLTGRHLTNGEMSNILETLFFMFINLTREKFEND